MKKGEAKKEKNILFLFFMVIILIVIILFFYFNVLIEKERIESEKRLEKLASESEMSPENLLEDKNESAGNILRRLKTSGVNRYFLSEIELIDDLYTPVIHTCLYENGEQIYPGYIYKTWASLQYPSYLSKEEPIIELIRYRLLPEDNDGFEPNKSCYIKEIKDEKDWDEIKKYNFYKSLFN